MTINDITDNELANLRTLVKIENFKSKKPITLEQIIVRELALASSGKSKYVSQKQKDEQPIHVTESIQEAEPTYVTEPSTLGCRIKVDTTYTETPILYTLVTDSNLVDIDNHVISLSSPLGSRLSNASVGDLVQQGDAFYQVLDIIPQSYEM